jgi:hypothetical protein
MLISEVKKLPMTERFLYWIEERDGIRLRRLEGQPKPWTDDEILQKYFFTNPYRENDKTTIWFRDYARHPLRNSPLVLMATVIFRWFNYIPTGILLISQNLLTSWDEAAAIRLLGGVRDSGGQVFTGGFMINSPGGEPKLEAICRRISNVWEDRQNLLNFELGQRPCSMQKFHAALTKYDGLGGFMAYEIVCDLRYTYLLQNASDKLTWCNPGPGCIRGLYRINGQPLVKTRKSGLVSNSTSPTKPKDWLKQMQLLLIKMQTQLSYMPAFEMREVEHSLCEFDKYCRALEGDGRMKRTYPGV